MSIDTKAKRLRAMSFASMDETLPEADGSIDFADRMHLLGLFYYISSSLVVDNGGSEVELNRNDATVVEMNIADARVVVATGMEFAAANDVEMNIADASSVVMSIDTSSSVPLT